MSIDEALAQLRAALPDHPRARRMIHELRDHLLSSVDELIGEGLAPDLAELEALRRLGPMAPLAHGLDRLIDADERARLRLAWLTVAPALGVALLCGLINVAGAMLGEASLLYRLTGLLALGLMIATAILVHRALRTSQRRGLTLSIGALGLFVSASSVAAFACFGCQLGQNIPEYGVWSTAAAAVAGIAVSAFAAFDRFNGLTA